MGCGNRALWSVPVCIGLLTGAAVSHAARNEAIEAIALGGVTQRVLIAQDDAQPIARVVVVFPGGDGVLGLAEAPTPPAPAEGYVSSLRRDLVRPGTALVLVDSPSVQPRMSVDYRESAEYRSLLKQLLADLRQRFNGAPLYLLGYSNGAVSALVAAREPGVAGVILVSGIFLRYSDVASFGAERPILVVHHEADRCVPPDFDESFRLRLRPTMVRGIAQPYGPSACAAVSAHQLYGQEGAVADVIHQWVLTGRAPSRLR